MRVFLFTWLVEAASGCGLFAIVALVRGVPVSRLVTTAIEMPGLAGALAAYIAAKAIIDVAVFRRGVRRGRAAMASGLRHQFTDRRA